MQYGICCRARPPAAAIAYVLGSSGPPPEVQCDVVAWQLFGLSMASYNAIFSFLIAAWRWSACRLVKQRRAMPRKPKPKAPGAAPDTEAMIRVDHAGEYGAVRIYEGQLAVLGQARQRRHHPPHGGAGTASPEDLRPAGE